MKDSEQDLHVWAKPATKDMTALFTVSVGKQSICVDVPIDAATDHIRAHLQEMVGED